MKATAKWLNYSKNAKRLEHKVNASPDGKGACDMSVIWGALCSESRGMGGSGSEWAYRKTKRRKYVKEKL